MPCLTCTVVSSIESAAMTTGQAVFGAIAPSMAAAMGSIAGVIGLWSLGRAALVGQSPHPQVMGLLLSTSIASFFLTSYSAYIAYLYAPIHDYTAWLVTTVLSAGSGGGGTVGGASGIMQRAEEVSFGAINLAWAMYRDASWYRLDLLIAGIMLMIPFLLSLVIFLGYQIYTIILTSVPVLLGPLLLVAGAFKASRKLLFSGLDFWISGAAIGVLSAYTMGISSLALTQATANLPAGMSPWQATGSATPIPAATAATYVGSTNYWFLVIISILNCFALALTPQLAGYFTGRVDSANLAAQAMNGAKSAVNTMADLKQIFTPRIKR